MAHDAAFYALLFLCMVAVCFFAFLLRKKLRALLRLLLRSGLGAVLLVLLNTFGAERGFGMGVNLITALIIGVLGLPGLVSLYFLKFILH